METSFGITDIVVFAVSLMLASSIGLYYAYTDRKKNLTNYYYGGKKMSPIPVGISISVTFMSAISVMSFPAETYAYGLVVIWYCFVTSTTTVFACLYFIPLYHRLQVPTIFELLEKRFSIKVRRICSGIEILIQTSLMGIYSYLPALALNAVTPLKLSWSIAVTGGLCTIYTAVGGIKAVIWADTLQSVFMVLGVFAAFIKGVSAVGGMDRVWRILESNGAVNMFNFDPDPRIRTTFWTIMVGLAAYQMLHTCCNQSIMQRYLSCKSVKDARIAAVFALLPKILVTTLCVMGGATAYVYFENCDPFKQNLLSKPDQIMPYFAMIVFRDLPGMAGVYVAAVYSGTLSTVSSGINSLAVLLLEDFVFVKRPNLSSKTKMVLSKFAVFSFGICATIISYIASTLPGSVIQMVVLVQGALGAPMLAVFISALFIPWTTSKGILIGQFTGTLVSAWLSIGSYAYGIAPEFRQKLPTTIDGCPATGLSNATTFTPLTVYTTTQQDFDYEYPAVYSLSFMYNALLGILVTISMGLIASFITGANKPKEFDPRYFVPIIDNRNFPKSVRSFFRFGVRPLNQNQYRDIRQSKELDSKINLNGLENAL